VYLYTVDDLSALVQTAGEKRQAAVAQAEAIIDAGVQNFVHWLEQRSAVPLIQALQNQAEAWRGAEIARARKLLAKGGSVDDAMEALARGLTQKLMHGALAELHNADPVQRAAMADAVSRLFLRGEVRHERQERHERGERSGTAAAASPAVPPGDGEGDAPAERRRA
jgi:glutamyl-tRNA reductase